MDRLEAVRIAAINLDRARDEEFHAEQALQRAKARLLKANADYEAALDAVHRADGTHGHLRSRASGANDDSIAKDRLQQAM